MGSGMVALKQSWLPDRELQSKASQRSPESESGRQDPMPLPQLSHWLEA